MSTIAIQVRNLGKKYQLGARESAYTTFREALSQALMAPFQRFRRLSGRAHEAETFWALKDVSFDIVEGEVVGVIGPNGAGKSTLFKILSQITEPTTGEVMIRGRLGSLLEVGTGFHSELSGRENIFLNGAILGMKRAEMARKFDDIVAFSGVEKFLDTPVKHYSSGMYVRLAFSVAAHLEPDILIVDEVLAVGDTEFQEKCMRKIQNIGASGRTVIMVSHSMGIVERLCSKVIHLDKGRVQMISTPREVIDEYLASLNTVQTTGAATDPVPDPTPGQLQFEPKTGPAYFISALTRDCRGAPSAKIDVREEFSIEVEYLVREALDDVAVEMDFYDRHENMVCTSAILKDQPRLEPGRYRSIVKIPGKFFTPGTFTFSVGIHRLPTIFDHRIREVSFEIVDTDSRFGKYHHGVVFVDFPWSTCRILS